MVAAVVFVPGWSATFLAIAVQVEVGMNKWWKVPVPGCRVGGRWVAEPKNAGSSSCNLDLPWGGWVCTPNSDTYPHQEHSTRPPSLAYRIQVATRQAGCVRTNAHDHREGGS